ncbi:MAG: hypothetical protein Q9164_007420, partial [Protoblastenia rupestris]
TDVARSTYAWTDQFSGDESMASGSDSDNEAVDMNGLRTPKPSPKHQKMRISPRSTGKKDYKALEDPFVNTNATDGEGNEIFKEEQSDSEDSCASDGEYGRAKHEVAV